MSEPLVLNMSGVPCPGCRQRFTVEARLPSDNIMLEREFLDNRGNSAAWPVPIGSLQVRAQITVGVPCDTCGPFELDVNIVMRREDPPPPWAVT